MHTRSGDSIFRPAFAIMSGRIIGFIASFVIPIVLARIFSQTEFGTYKQLFLIFGTLFAIGQMGMSESLYYFVPGASKRGSSYVLNSLLMLTLSGLVLLALLWINAANISRWLNNSALDKYIPYIGIFLLLMLLASVLEISMITHKRHGLVFGTYALSDILRALLFILPAVLFHSLQALLLGAIAFAALRLTTTLIYLKREYSRSFKYDYESWKKHLAYALPFALAIVLETVQSSLHFYVVSSRFDAAIFAIYAVGCLQVPLTDFLMTSTSSVMMVRMREEARRGSTDKVLALWLDTTRKLAFLLVPFIGTLVVTAHALIVTLYTARYVDSVDVFEVWSATSLFSILLTDSIMRVYAKTRFLILLNIAKLAVIASTIVLFLDWFGLIGGVLSTLIAALVSKIISLWKSKQILQCSVSDLLPWRPLARISSIALAAAVPAMAIRLFVSVPQIVELFLIPALYLGTYTSLVWWYGPILPHEKQLVINAAQRFAVRYLIPRRL